MRFAAPPPPSANSCARPWSAFIVPHKLNIWCIVAVLLAYFSLLNAAAAGFETGLVVTSRTMHCVGDFMTSTF